ncbi:MAG: hypothetical protein Q9201_000058 [Fulgogasparrea decipioides]
MAITWRSPQELKELIKQDRPMQVFIMGMPRSGTMYERPKTDPILKELALVAALKKLGYTPYDFIDRILLGHLPLWTDALCAKYEGKGRPWGRPEFDRVFKGFDCVLDVPCTFFPLELSTSYPRSLLILNARPAPSWHRSMTSTLFHVFRWPSWPLLARLDPTFTGKWYEHILLTFQIFCNNDYSAPACIEAYNRHYEHVREVVPKERLLEWSVEEGWEPLCKFLGKKVPEEEGFPYVNDTEAFVKGHGMLWSYAVFNAVKNLGLGALSIGLGWWAAWYMYKTRADRKLTELLGL